MGSFVGPFFVDRWIGDGGIVVAASERAARAIQEAYHHRRREEGATAWPAPPVQSWLGFLSASWEQYARDERMILNSAQEQQLWAEIVGRERRLVTELEAPRRRMARLAMDAHSLLCSYAPRFLRETARAAWDRDAAAFSRWLSAFDEVCRHGAFISPSRLALDLIPILARSSTTRPPILLIGFDRLLPIHKEVFDAWGASQQPEPSPTSSDLHFHQARDEESELSACAAWCMRQLAQQPNASLLVITQQIAERRGEIERAFLRAAAPGVQARFEFSLGVPLLQIPLARAAFFVLRWLETSLTESELDWLFASGYVAARESLALQGHMRSLRRRNLARPEWTLDAFLAASSLPSSWTHRMHQAQSILSSAKGRVRTPIEWVSLIPDLLGAVELPGERSLSSAEFQAWRRWRDALDVAGSLGFDGRRIAWPDFLSSLERILETTVFAPESTNAPIQITGPGESAGLAADAVWFLGADEDAWPASGSAHPLLPVSIQREFAMPHASPRHDAELAASITQRLITSAAVVNFSYASLRGEAETRPSRIVAQRTGSPRPMQPQLAARLSPRSLALAFDDLTRVPFAAGKAPGGASVLTAQSQCPFKAFAIARLDARAWEPAEFGLSASQRGLLLHEVMHAVWGGPPEGFHSLQDLLDCRDVHSFVAGHVDRVLQSKLSDEIRDRMPRQYLMLEATRLTTVITEWLEYESKRRPFTVVQTESACSVNIAGLSLDLRLDRTDKLNDGSLLVVDYKTGYVSPRDWDLPRPDDVQLPLYAGFACDAQLGGLVFAKLRAGDHEFAGRAVDATATLLPELRGKAIAKKPLTPEHLADWRSYIEQLARDFIAGRADLDPRDYPKTCDACGLHAICRIHENWTEPEPEDELEDLPYE